MLEVVALSGGKDSTAMALRLEEVEPDVDRVFFCTPTGDELPGMVDHWSRLEEMLGLPLVRLSPHTLDGLIEGFGSLPNWRQRWCTRMLKIEPCLAYIAKAQAIEEGDVRLAVGLRADEPTREGIYSDTVVSRFPLREWGWGIEDVVAYNKSRGIKVPSRTDCARCYGQRLSEWWELWMEYPGVYEDAVKQERETGHTFRSPQRDTWPASLADVRARFQQGHLPRGTKHQLALFEDEDELDQGCRVCRI